MLYGEVLGWVRRWEERRSVERVCIVVFLGEGWVRLYEEV